MVVCGEKILVEDQELLKCSLCKNKGEVNMLYEIDFLPVGNGEGSGDAICLRYSEDSGVTWKVGVVDGGSQESGESLCEHIQKYYSTRTVDFLVCTHPHQDHASGLTKVIETLEVKKVLMHCPWDYVDHFYDKVADGRVTKESLIRRLKDGHPSAYRVYELAVEKGIPIHDAFLENPGHGIPCLSIVGPSESFYLSHVVNFQSIREITEDVQEKNRLESFKNFVKKISNMISETWDDEKLVDPASCSTPSENNTSIISMFDFAGSKFLLTADAGVEALEDAADHIEDMGHVLKDFKFFQVPHHGSRRNLGPTVLNRIIGSPLPETNGATFTAFISATEGDNPKHPSKRVVNAIIRRGGKVVATQGAAKCHHSGGLPPREGWVAVEPLPFYSQVEESVDD